MRSSSEWKVTTTSRPPGLSTARPRKRRGELGELLVDEDAQRLERAGRRMDLAGPGAHDARDDVGERARGRIGASRARGDDGAGDGARMPLFAERRDDGGKIALGGRATTSAALGPRRPCACRAGPS